MRFFAIHVLFYDGQNNENFTVIKLTEHSENWSFLFSDY